MPYRIDISSPPADAFEQLVQLGALDIETTPQGIAAIIPDGVTLDDAKCALGVESVAISPAVSRDSGSVWQLSPRAIRIGSVSIVPEAMALPGALRLTESTIFGTGHHPTTGLCIEAIEEALTINIPDSILDVGTGSGDLGGAGWQLRRGASRDGPPGHRSRCAYRSDVRS